jgi:DNA polymerase elongation subunit (family B)
MAKEHVGFEEIENFLEGRDPQKYIVAIEAAYHKNEVYLVINDPERGKRIETHTYKPFLWIMDGVADHMYSGSRNALKKGMKKFGVKFKSLRIADGNGVVPKRMEDGFKYMAECSGSYSDMLNFFKEGGIDVFSQTLIPNTEIEQRSLFVTFPPAEQFLISTGKRLFKGMDDYNDVHRMQFDLETMGLTASTDPIFQIGIRDNRGYEEILEIKGDTPQELRDSERIQIARFFDIIFEIKPDIITAYNSEFFDWPYLERRCERLGIDITEIARTLKADSKFRRKPSRLKVGSETLEYDQTMMWGINILDISHTVRKTMAINSSIKSWSLKYITKFSGVAKTNRVYVEGDKIHTTWADKSPYAFSDVDGTFYKITEERPLEEGYVVKNGDYIVQRYLLDDLWETEQVDGIYNQAAFLVGKILPTSYTRSSTMGTAGQWKLIMAAWSYEKGLGIPALTKKRDFTGGLSRLLEVGYAKNVDKFDYAALYPKTQLTWGIFPELDISGVMEGLLTYVVDTRDEFKFKAGNAKDEAKRLQKLLDKNRGKLSPERIVKAEQMITDQKKLASDFDKKQLPLKILANSFFGAYGAPYLFNWGDSDCAEETTCRGRQSLRLMVKVFKGDYGFRPLVGDTDGFNFARPDSINDYEYLATGEHWKTEGQGGKTLKGVDAVLAEFNETYMEGRMGLDLDDVCSSTINFARKNYANAIGDKVKLVGNTVKSNKMPIYIEEFLDKAVKMLLDGDGYSFVNYYYDYIDKIYNYQIPLMKIASKGKVKKSVDAYKKHVRGKNKAGNSNPRQAHMELVVKDGVNVSLGDVIYYVNIGESKSTGDLKTITDKETNKKKIELNCIMISREEMEKNPDMTTDDYNVARYINAFNKRIRPLLVCFSKGVRERQEEVLKGKYKGTFKTIDNILVEVVKHKDKDTNKIQMILEDRKEFTEKECELVAGHPYNPEDQDSYDALMTMEDKEIRFWTSVNKLPNFMEQDEWDVIVVDYEERMRVERLEGIQSEKDRLDAIFQTLEVKDLSDIETYGLLPKMVEIMCILYTDEESGVFYLQSRKWDVNLCKFDDLWRYEVLAKERAQFYINNGNLDGDDRYEQWLDFKAESEFLHGDSGTTADEQGFEEVNLEGKVTKWMEADGWVEWMGNSFIRQEWVDNNKPYDRMAIPYPSALSMYNNRNAKDEWKEAVEEHKREVKENKDEYK